MELRNMIQKDEEILWSGQPNMKSFLLQKITNGLGIALIFLLFDSVFIFAMFSAENQLTKNEILILVGFFAVHLVPVWIWFATFFTAKASWKNTEYMVTNKRIMLKSGIIGNDITSFFYVDIKNIYVNVGLIDRLMGTGDLIIQQNIDLGAIFARATVSPAANNQTKNVIRDIDNPYEVYNQIQQIINDIMTDMAYPNANRPNNNPGYRTQYKNQ